MSVFSLQKKPQDKDFNWKIGGEAGWGIKSTGLIFSKTFVRGGYHVFSYDEYPSLVRGGHNCYQTLISEEKKTAPRKEVDLLVALNEETIDKHRDELKPQGVILYEKGQPDNRNIWIEIPFTKITQEIGVPELMKNNASLGASIALCGYDLNLLIDVIRDYFEDKGEEIIEKNILVARKGFDYIKENFPEKYFNPIKPRNNQPRQILLTGNEAVGLGAITGGLKFYPVYPMTPASSILHFLAKWAQKYNLLVLQTEDEISAVNMAIGGAYAGLRTMTGTSGGGFALMTESLGLAGMTETPLVIVVSQRPGPATGIPTWTGQGDLRFVLHAHQDHCPRIVLAPGDNQEAFDQTIEALNLAEKYQMPVILLIDKLLSESHESCSPFNSETEIDRGNLINQKESDQYGRYADSPTGVSPRAIPGTPGIIIRANSDEHDTYGFSREESHLRKKMMEKRQKKMEFVAKEMPCPRVYGDPDSLIWLTAWGTTKGAVLEAQRILRQENIETAFLHYTHLSPFPKEFTEQNLKGKKVLNIEGNFDGALSGLIRQMTGIEIKDNLLKYDGRPFYPEEIVDRIKKL